MYQLSKIAQELNGKLVGKDNEHNWTLLIDSRNLTQSSHTIFFAITTKFNNGHLYIEELYHKGVRQFVVEPEYNTLPYPDASFIVVENTLKALQNLSSFHRQLFNIPVIGITGSNGKTIVKEWLLQLLAQEFSICASPKSYNSQIGVPLSVWQLNKDHELAIFEAGISQKGEMERLSSIIQANIGILTHMGTAHDEGFDDFNQKLNEKIILFKNSNYVITKHNAEIISKLSGKAITYDYNNPKADLNIISKTTEQQSVTLNATYLNQNYTITIPFKDEISIDNICLCWLFCLKYNCYKAESFTSLKPISMRMELKKGINNCIVVNDSYSNDLQALSVALSFLKQQNIYAKTTLILSDIQQSGLNDEVLTQHLIDLLKEKQIQRIIGIGPNFIKYQTLFQSAIPSSQFYIDTNTFLENFKTIHFENEGILIKGARQFAFEKIAKKLELQSHGTVLEINLNAALHNLNVYKKELLPNQKMMAMVKAFAYGSGSYEIAKLLNHKVDYFAVAFADEGVELRKSGINTPIMVLNVDAESILHILQYKLEPVIYSIRQIYDVIPLIGDAPISIHIELDTGMHRLGISMEEITQLCQEIIGLKNWKIASVFSHLSASEEAIHDTFTQEQYQLFETACSKIEQSVGYSFEKHISNTAAISRFKFNTQTMVRLGIGLYGIDPSGTKSHLLEPVFTLKTTITQIKNIKANESVGYSRKGIVDHERKIGILAIGYADGINRKLSNGIGCFYVNGKVAPIIGNICMDMCMVDLSNINCSEGDTALLFGKDNPITNIASLLNTIPYEVLTSISQRVKRVYINE
jgi:alanine racemase